MGIFQKYRKLLQNSVHIIHRVNSLIVTWYLNLCVHVHVYMFWWTWIMLWNGVPGISVRAPIRRSTPWSYIRKNFPFVPTIEMSTLFSFPSKNQLNAQGAVTENPGMSIVSLHGSFIIISLGGGGGGIIKQQFYYLQFISFIVICSYSMIFCPWTMFAARLWYKYNLKKHKYL